ncbi:MAG: hypothetical protein JXA15_12125 [Spirochaetales bacterium]|nr:hypothetical protein [Spirochaetales bacterium]
MKRSLALIACALILSGPCLAQDAALPAAPSFNALRFSMDAPGNGYFFSWEPAIEFSDWSLDLLGGYGQAYSDGSSFLDSLLYRGGVGFTHGIASAGLAFGKGFPLLAYAPLGIQTGASAAARLELSSALNLQQYAFYGRLDNLGQRRDDALYGVTSAFGTFYEGVGAEFGYRTDLSTFRDEDGGLSWGLQNAARLALAGDALSVACLLGYVEQGESGLAGGFRYDFSSFAPGVPAGLAGGNAVAALEARARAFPLSWFGRIPFVSSMLYFGGIAGAAAFLERGEPVESLETPWYLGFGGGLLFFELDICLSYGYSPLSGWVLKFQMRSKGLDKR